MVTTPTQLLSRVVIDGTDILYRDYVDISVAVATPKVRVNFDLWVDVTSDPMTFDPRGWLCRY